MCIAVLDMFMNLYPVMFTVYVLFVTTCSLRSCLYVYLKFYYYVLGFPVVHRFFMPTIFTLTLEVVLFFYALFRSILLPFLYPRFSISLSISPYVSTKYINSFFFVVNFLFGDGSPFWFSPCCLPKVYRLCGIWKPSEVRGLKWDVCMALFTNLEGKAIRTSNALASKRQTMQQILSSAKLTTISYTQ